MTDIAAPAPGPTEGRVLCPMIESDGQLGELELTHEQLRSEPVFVRTKSTPEGVIVKEVYARCAFHYQVKDQLAVVFIFVNQRFGDKLAPFPKEREKWITTFVHQRAAWFFTYGVRQLIAAAPSGELHD